MHNSFSENYNNLNKNSAHERHLEYNLDSQLCGLFESCGTQVPLMRQ